MTERSPTFEKEINISNVVSSTSSIECPCKALVELLKAIGRRISPGIKLFVNECYLSHNRVISFFSSDIRSDLNFQISRDEIKHIHLESEYITVIIKKVILEDVEEILNYDECTTSFIYLGMTHRIIGRYWFTTNETRKLFFYHCFGAYPFLKWYYSPRQDFCVTPEGIKPIINLSWKNQYRGRGYFYHLRQRDMFKNKNFNAHYLSLLKTMNQFPSYGSTKIFDYIFKWVKDKFVSEVPEFITITKKIKEEQLLCFSLLEALFLMEYFNEDKVEKILSQIKVNEVKIEEKSKPYSFFRVIFRNRYKYDKTSDGYHIFVRKVD